MKKNIFKFFSTIVILGSGFVFPMIVSADSLTTDQNVIDVINKTATKSSNLNTIPAGGSGTVSWIIYRMINIIISLTYLILLPLCFLLFFYGISKYLYNSDNEEARSNGKGFMIWSVIAIFVISTMWGLSLFLSNQFGFTNGKSFPIPQLRDLKN